MSEAAPQIPDDDRHATPAAGELSRPDWLVSADEGSESERDRGPTGAPPVPLKLTGANDFSEQKPMERPGVPHAPPAPPEPPKPVAWTAAASSVPTLKSVPPLTPPLTPPLKPPHKMPLKMPPRAPAPDATGLDDEVDAADPLAASSPRDAFAIEPEARAPVAPPRRVLREAWWVIALDSVRSNQRIQLLGGGAFLLLLAAWIFWPRSEPGISLATLRHDPARWDGQTVRVHGRIGDVFHVGGGYAYNLHQGRDTIVVFTRSRVPVSDHNTTVVGSVSTGFLDGLPRQAIFEQTP